MDKQLLYEKLLFLERKLPVKPIKSFLEPFDFDSVTEKGLQYAVNKMTKHIGFKEKMFDVCFSVLDSGHAGKIHLSYWEETNLIEVNHAFAGKNEVILGILAHEVTHKVLHKFELEEDDEYENEKLTDLCSIYLGFGKLVLNGKDLTRWNNYSVSFGYLSKEKLAFAFNLFVGMNKIDRGKCRDNLLRSSDSIVKVVYAENKEYFDEKFRDEDYILTILISMRNVINDLQILIVVIDIMFDKFKFNNKEKGYYVYVDIKLTVYELNKLFCNIQIDMQKFYDYHELSANLKYFHSIELKKYITTKQRIIVKKVDKLLLELNKLIKINKEMFFAIRPVVFYEKCPFCRTKQIRAQESGSKGFYCCKKCNYVFSFVNNEDTSIANIEEQIENILSTMDSSFARRVKKRSRMFFYNKKKYAKRYKNLDKHTDETTIISKPNLFTRIMNHFLKK
jgi:hypothetical protein